MTTTFAQTGPAAPSNGIWMIIDTSYQLGTNTAGVTNANLTFRNTTATKVTGAQFRVFYDKNAFSAAAVTLIGSSTNLDLQFVDNNAGGYITITLVYTGSSNVYTIPEGETFNLALTHVAGATFQTLAAISNLTWATIPAINTYPQLAAQQDGTDIAMRLHNYGGTFLRQQLDFTVNFVNVNGTPAQK